ncbi:MAG TPA: NUDIX hydrolase [Gammaproteobacteria bacterium]|jgi:8-oxo-dGTP pyrophosphatase MutT (NUDIX family)|nr:NUDIX hydrolase [Gammaproteobacteria bacterium]
MAIKDWREVAREQVADCRVFSVERSIAESPVDGSPHTFYRIHSGSWAQIVPVTKEHDVVLVRQYRHGASKVTLEMPAGLVDPGEDPAQAAVRECLEETGYRARDPISLGVVNPNPALFANRLYAFLATDVVPERAIKNDRTEQTEVELVPTRALSKLLLDGTIDHALVIATLWRYLHEFA